MPSIEINPALILREPDEAQKGLRKLEECIPENLQTGQICPFLKKGLRIYWLDGEIPLIVKLSGGETTRPIASIQIVETTHFTENGQIFTRGLYRVTEVFEDEGVHFEGLDKIKGKTTWSSKLKNLMG